MRPKAFVRLPAMLAGTLWAAGYAPVLALPTQAEMTHATTTEAAVRSLASLADFGRADNGEDQGPAFAISPDGSRAALIVRYPDVETNKFRQRLIIMALSSTRATETHLLRAQPVGWAIDIRGFTTPNGNFLENRPRWSPDGTKLAYLAADVRGPQVTILDLRFKRETTITAIIGGVVDLAWDDDSRGLSFVARPGLATHEQSLDREALSGYHFDRRVSPMARLRPMPPATLAMTRGHVRIDFTHTAALPAPRPTNYAAPPAKAGVERAGGSATGRTALIAPVDKERWDAPLLLSTTVAGRTTICRYATCRGRLIGPWIAGSHIIYLRREGWGDSLTTVYLWRPEARPQRVFTTGDLLVGCDTSLTKLICARETSTRPRHLWSIDLASGHRRILFDPNPHFRPNGHRRVERLHWRGNHRSEGYGDLAIPRTPPPPGGYPLVVVQYRTRGFLRGAVGDEYPIFPMTARGFAVLSVEAPKYYPLLVQPGRAPTVEAAMRLAQQDNNERCLQHDNLKRGIAAAGTIVRIDRARMAVTGVSDAASSAVFALIHSDLFSVAALGSPDIDRETLVMGGPALAEEFQSLGYPMTAREDDVFYRALSLSANADRIRAPILFQLPEAEYLAGLSSYTRLANAGRAVDLYVFPGEHHLKSQPSHKLAVYARNLDWLSFWLLGDGNDRQSRDENARWRTLRDRGCQASGSRRLPVQLCSQASTLTSSEMRR